MTLTRVWTPSGNYSSGGTKRLIVLHTMEGFTGANGAYDCAKYFQGNVGASSQVCIDNNRGKIWECVTRNNASWTQCNFNSVAVSAEQSGYASWSRDYWLANRENELRNTAEWVAEEAAKFGIPLRILTASEAQGGGKGICQHMNLGSSGCAHSDCGPNYPIDKVLEWAKGGSTVVPASGGYMSVGAATDPDGNEHYVCIGRDDGSVYYFPPGWSNWGKVDPGQKGAKSGADISIGHDWMVTLTYVNGSDKPCRYRKRFRDTADWGWSQIGNINAR
jgi:hypothetical protein